MPEWLDKAKEAAMKAAEEAKKLAEAAKNADYGSMIDKTKNMAMHAADEAKKAADNIMKKEHHETKPDVVPEQDNPLTGQPTATQGPTQTTTQAAQQPAQPIPKASVQPSTQAFPSSQTFDGNKPQLLAKIAQVEQLLREIKELLQ